MPGPRKERARIQYTMQPENILPEQGRGRAVARPAPAAKGRKYGKMVNSARNVERLFALRQAGGGGTLSHTTGSDAPQSGPEGRCAASSAPLRKGQPAGVPGTARAARRCEAGICRAKARGPARVRKLTCSPAGWRRRWTVPHDGSSRRALRGGRKRWGIPRPSPGPRWPE